MNDAIGQQVSANPLLCFLGSVPNFLKQHEEVIQSLLMLARKATMVKWIGDDPPTVLIWKSLISKVMTLEKLRLYINGRIHIFQQKWKRPLEHLGVKYNLELN